MGSSLSLHQTKLVYNDHTHTYTLNGRRCKSVTAVAKIAPDSFTIEQWDRRQVAIGMMLEPKLAERVAVDPDNRDAVQKVCEDAKEIAKANDAARRGTQRHRAAELIDLGMPMLTDQQRADAVAWQRTLEAYEIEILPQHVEGFAVWPEHGVAGRFDRLARYRGHTICVDLKSGQNAVKYPQGTAVQLSLYARAPMISANIDTDGDRSTVIKWTKPPSDLDLETGYVILLGDGMDIGELWRINIEHGWDGARHALSLVDWRKMHGYGKQLAEQVPPPLVQPTTDLWPWQEMIQSATSAEALEDIWRQAASRGEWTPELTEHARRAKEALTSLATTASSR